MNVQSKNYLLFSFLLGSAMACGGEPGAAEVPTDVDAEALAMEAIEVAGASVRALSAATMITADSAALQGDRTSLQTPQNAQGPCVRVTVGPSISLRVDHGSGCRIGSIMVSGAYVLTLLTQQQLGLEVMFQMLQVNGLGLDGRLTAGLGLGRLGAAMDLDVVTNGVTHQLDFSGSVRGQQLNLWYDGSGSYDAGMGSWSFNAGNVRQTLGLCYPDAGSITVTGQSGIPVTFTFTHTTPQTGLVDVRVGRIPLLPLPLPAYGPCPAGP